MLPSVGPGACNQGQREGQGDEGGALAETGGELGQVCFCFYGGEQFVAPPIEDRFQCPICIK